MSRGYVIGLAALPATGKGELAAQLAPLGVEHLHVGSIVRLTAKNNGFVPSEDTREAYLPFWRQYSTSHGEDWLARVAINAAEEHDKTVLLDGLRIPADVQAINDAPNGMSFWLSGDLLAIARRIIKRRKPEDKNTSTLDDCVDAMKRDLADNGNFAMGAVRELCTVHLLPIPEIPEESERAACYHNAAKHILKVSGIPL